MKNITILSLVFFLSSCARILNQPYTKINIHTSEPSKIIVNSDTIETIRNRVTIELERKKEAVKIIAQTDSTSKTITLYPKISKTYYWNFMNYGVGYIADLGSPKRFGYKRNTFIGFSDTPRWKVILHPRRAKGDIFFHISLPIYNTFELRPNGEPDSKTNSGFWGISLGLDYYYAKNRYFNISQSFATDYYFIIPVPVELRDGPEEDMNTSYQSISHNHKLSFLSLGYGFSYNKNVWTYRYHSRFGEPPPRENARKITYSLGLVFPFHLQLGRNFHLGMIYRPSFYRANAIPHFKYESLISLDFAWKIEFQR